MTFWVNLSIVLQSYDKLQNYLICFLLFSLKLSCLLSDSRYARMNRQNVNYYQFTHTFLWSAGGGEKNEQ